VPPARGTNLPDFRVVTDSTADLPAEWAQRHRIEVVPLKVLFGNETFRDGVDLDSDQFFNRLARSSKLPTTSAPSPGDFAAVYERLAKECEGVISIHIGSQLSATVESARVGARSVEGFPVHVIDSRSVTMTIAFLCRVAAQSPSLAEAVQRVEERIPQQRVIALLDTLRYIEMGGRVNRATAMIGTMLDLKPLLGVAAGDIKPLDRVRTRGRAIPRMVELLREDYPLEHVAVMHAQAPDEAEKVAAEVRPELEKEGVEVVTGQIGAVLGTHTGPKALGFAYLKR
jgi:DegV family protein with EDD domain